MAANNDEPLFFISYCPVVTGPVKRVLKGISMLQNAHRRSERNSLSTRAEPIIPDSLGPQFTLARSYLRTEPEQTRRNRGDQCRTSARYAEITNR
jgi:hypothetical protein